MAYTAATLNPIGGQSRASNTTGKGIAIWTYTTDDASATVDTSGYFNDASAILRINDLIFVATTSTGAITGLGIHIVNGNSAGVVDVTNVINITSTIPNDSD
jgi:hypothetical protein